MLCEGKGSLGQGFFDYSAGVPRDGVEKTSFGMTNHTFLIENKNRIAILGDEATGPLKENKARFLANDFQMMDDDNGDHS